MFWKCQNLIDAIWYHKFQLFLYTQIWRIKIHLNGEKDIIMNLITRKGETRFKYSSHLRILLLMVRSRSCF